MVREIALPGDGLQRDPRNPMRSPVLPLSFGPTGTDFRRPQKNLQRGKIGAVVVSIGIR